VNFRGKNGAFTNPGLGSHRATGSHRRLKTSDSFRTKVPSEGEQLLFVWRGAIQVKSADGVYTAGERDTVFVTGPAELEVRGDSGGETEIIQVEAPPASGIPAQ
jgi:hypothetical protein